MQKEAQMKSKRKAILLWIGLVVVMLLALGGWGWQAVQAQLQATQAADSAAAYQTTAAHKGDLALTISGTGTLITSNSVDLAFATAGTLAQVNVQVGDVVEEGQVLATLQEIEALQLEVENRQLAMQLAQQTLDTLTTHAQTLLTQAAADLAAAQTTYEEAQANVHAAGDARCDPAKTRDYYFVWLAAQKQVDEWEGYLNDPNTGYGRDYILQKLSPMRKERNQALANMTYCQGYTEEEIQTSQANLQLAQARRDQAQTVFDNLNEHEGMDPQAVRIAETALKNARLQWVLAQNNLSGATLAAPMAGTVMAVNGASGETFGTGTFITLADLEHPVVQVSVDETDALNFGVGCSAQVTFTSLPNQIFTGQVTQVSPALAAVQSVSMAQGLITFDEVNQAAGRALPPGLAAAVEITCQETQGALIIPAQAVYAGSAGQPDYVYVLDAQNQPEKREVQVGLRTAASVEIRSGLNTGEKVITSTVAGE